MEVGRAIRGGLGGLARPYTPYVEPVALAVVTGVGIQATTIVVQVVLVVAIVRGS